MYSLFEARNFKDFLHCFLKQKRNQIASVFPEIERKWYENPKFMVRIAEMNAKYPSEFKKVLPDMLWFLPNSVLVKLFDALAQSQDGWDTILSMKNPPSLLIEAIFNYDSSGNPALEQKIVEKLTDTFSSRRDLEGCYCLKLRYNLANARDAPRFGNGDLLRFKTLVMMGRLKEAAEHVHVNDAKFAKDIDKWRNKVSFHRFMVENHLEDYKKHCNFIFNLVDYDPELVFKFYGFSSWEALFSDALIDKERIRHLGCPTKIYPDFFFHCAFKMFYRNSMFDEFQSLLEMGFSIENFDVNLTALIDLKGDDHEEFMKYFTCIAESRTESSWHNYLKFVHFDKLVSIPGALECLFDRQFVMHAEDLVIFLQYERAYRLLLERKRNFTVKDRIDIISLRETVLERIKMFIPSKKMASLYR